MRLPDAHSEEQERRKQLLSATAKGNDEAQKELQREYRVRLLSAEEGAAYTYARSSRPGFKTYTGSCRPPDNGSMREAPPALCSRVLLSRSEGPVAG